MTRTDLTPEQFEHLFTTYSPEVRSYLRRRVGDDADDLLSEVFIVAWNRRRDLPDSGKQRAWLFGVARNLLRSTARQEIRSHAAVREQSRLFDVTDSPALDMSNSTIAVRAAMATLSEPDRELIMLTTWERLSIADAATVMGLRPGTARVRLHRARRQLAAHPQLQNLVQSNHANTTQ